MFKLTDVIIPAWGKWVAAGVMAVALVGFGYVKGLDHAYKQVIIHDVKVVVKQGKVTTKVITKYIKQKEKDDKVNEQIVKEGNSYPIEYPNDTNTVNNRYVRLFNDSVNGTLPTLPSGDDGDSSGVTNSETLQTSINNNIVARYWKNRGLTCEQWAADQEKAANK